jgi:ribosomal protein S18 acetylase RimI-like enzyme
MRVHVLRKRLTAEPPQLDDPAIELAACRIPEDVADWLALRERAFAGETPPVRPWQQADFLREFVGSDVRVLRPTWLARCKRQADSPVCGAVSLSLPKAHGHAARLHWLMVDTDCRRRGIGSLLVNKAERYSWEAGVRELCLETHQGWEAAIRFYRQRGYQNLIGASQ